MRTCICPFIGLSLLCLPAVIKAQTDQQVLNKYPAHVVLKIDEITSKVHLPVEKQVELARYFKRQDSLANDAMLQGKPLSEVQHYTAAVPDLRKMLSETEWMEYNSGLGSPFAQAFKWRKELKLTPAQIDSLLSYEKKLQEVNSKEKSTFQQEKLSKTLSQKQYTYLLFQENEPKAELATMQTWQELKRLNLINEKDTAALFKKLYQLEFSRLQAIARAPVSSKDSVITWFRVFRPRVFYLLDYHKSSLPESEFASVLKYSKEIALSEAQVDQLISSVIELEQTRRLAKEYNTWLWEHSRIVKIIGSEQLNKYLFHKTKAKAQGDWEALAEAGYSQGMNKDKTIQTAFTYEHAFLIAAGKFDFINTAKNEAEKTRIYAHKPFFLWKVDAYRNRLPASELANVLKYSREIGLSLAQKDTLLNKIKELELFKLDFNEYNVDWRPYGKPLETKGVLAVLSNAQLESYIHEKNRLKALANARIYWLELQLNGLNKGLVKEGILSDLEQYELKKLKVMDRAALLKSVVNDSISNQVLANKPFILLKLDAYQNRLPASEFSSLIKFRKEAGLRPGQIDSLLKKMQEVELLKYAYLSQNPQGRFNSRPFETSAVTEMLESKQLSAYLFYKNKAKAASSAIALYQKLEAAGLVKEVERAKLRTEIIGYEQKRLIAADKLSFQNTRKNQLYLKGIENQKPPSLISLETLERENKAAALKQSYAW